MFTPLADEGQLSGGREELAHYIAAINTRYESYIENPFCSADKRDGFLDKLREIDPREIKKESDIDAFITKNIDGHCELALDCFDSF